MPEKNISVVFYIFCFTLKCILNNLKSFTEYFKFAAAENCKCLNIIVLCNTGVCDITVNTKVSY